MSRPLLVAQANPTKVSETPAFWWGFLLFLGQKGR